ncbi:hypothetical protein AB1Y20_004773 [Prymnesium parvum]|uniref:Uncharacterized protein n=1 Tax=Prymnesium parvum TaxID=97485 RepID=A0AB34IZ89_PRYPA
MALHLAATAAAMLQAAPESMVRMISIIGGSTGAAQQLPVSLASAWPVWIARPDGSSVTRVPDSRTAPPSAEADTPDSSSWVDPITFEQLWLPQDLPFPQCSVAVGMVLKDGMPRYLFPTFVSSVVTGSSSLAEDGLVWYNRGVNSLPIGKQWVVFGDSSISQLRISCYSGRIPPRPVQLSEDASEADKERLAKAHAQAELDFSTQELVPILTLAPVVHAVEVLFKILADSPPELGHGFQFLIAPLSDDAGGSLGRDAVQPGRRIRCWLSEIDTNPENIGEGGFDRAECDISIYAVPAGSESPYLPEVYNALYQPCPANEGL